MMKRIALILCLFLALQPAIAGGPYLQPEAGLSGDMLRSKNLSDLSDKAQARENLGLADLATAAASDYLSKAGNLAGLADASASRGNLGLGTVATYAVGTTEGTVAVLGVGGVFASARIPAVTMPYGCRLSNAADTNHDITVSAGYRVSETDYATGMTLASAVTKRIDAGWAAGTGNGGLDTGSVANSSTYHVWLISTGSTVDVLFSLSVTAPTMPAGYTLKTRLVSLRTNSSADILNFIQTGKYFELKTPVLDEDRTDLTTSKMTVTLESIPTGITVEAKLNIRIDSGGSAYVYISSVDGTNMAPSLTAAPLSQMRANNIDMAAQLTVMTNTSAQIAARSSEASTTLKIVTLGWYDHNLQF